jgi:hypothetical protein
MDQLVREKTLARAGKPREEDHPPRAQAPELSGEPRVGIDDEASGPGRLHARET